MTTPVMLSDDIPASLEQTITEAEKASLQHFEDQRRYNLLRYIIPGIFILASIGMPFAIAVDLLGHTIVSTAQTSIAFVGSAVAFWALRQRRMTVASLAIFAAVTGVTYFLVIYDSIFAGPLSLKTLPEFALLLVPIVLAGVIGGRILTISITLVTPLITFLIITFAPHDALLTSTLAQFGNTGIYTIPIGVQLGLGLLILVTSNSLRRTQSDLNTVRIAYNRERELDRLKNQFISNVNHELRTPLMSMRGYLVLARELGLRQDPVQQEYMLNRGLETVSHMESIVESILDIRRIETDTASIAAAEVNVRKAIIAATQLLDLSMAGNRERDLHLRVDDKLTVMADEEKLRQVILNLLTNACKYSPSGTTIEIAAHPTTDVATNRSRDTDSANMVEFSIRDHGFGIPQSQIPLLFQRFVRLERDIASNIPGTGLGLAICRAYVEAMGGRIWVESTGVAGEGSTFLFVLPQPVAVAAAIPAVR